MVENDGIMHQDKNLSKHNKKAKKQNNKNSFLVALVGLQCQISLDWQIRHKKSWTFVKIGN